MHVIESVRYNCENLQSSMEVHATTYNKNVAFEIAHFAFQCSLNFSVLCYKHDPVKISNYMNKKSECYALPYVLRM